MHDSRRKSADGRKFGDWSKRGDSGNAEWAKIAHGSEPSQLTDEKLVFSYTQLQNSIY
jgi:hypothetical protein